jgi:hypothetical protein
MNAMVAGAVAPYDLRPMMRSGSGYDYRHVNGERKSFQEIYAIPGGQSRNSDHTTAEMRTSLAAAWEAAQPNFLNTASAFMDAGHARHAMGELIVPRPDDIAQPDRMLYLPNIAVIEVA